MKSKNRIIVPVCACAFAVIFLILALLLKGDNESEPIKTVMKDAVLHNNNTVNLSGISVNPAVISAFTVTAILIILALIVRIFFIPRFKKIPGKFQMLIEQAVGFFNSLAKADSPGRNKFLGAYIFTAGVYVFFGTLFELFGFQAVTGSGTSVSLPAPLSDINGAISLGCLSYGVILFGGLMGNGIKGALHALKDFSLPISMSFRLFGALLSGLLVTELVYYYVALSFVLPVIVGVMFTILHAIIQTYVLIMLTSLFYGESAKKAPEKNKNIKSSEVN